MALDDQAGERFGIEHKPRRSFRSLIAFWMIVIGMLGGIAIYLQIQGPPPLPRKIEVPPPAPPKPRDMVEPAPKARAITAPDPALEESASASIGLDRKLPIKSGARESKDVYAAQAPVPGNLPRIALVVDGVGLDDALAAQAIALPYQVDLAFSAYPKTDIDIGKLGKTAKDAGHECLVSIPMSETGVSSFRQLDIYTSGTEQQNRENLERALSNVAGCVGATSASDGATGHEFASRVPAAFKTLVSQIEQRGLLYLDARVDQSHDVPLDPPLPADDQHLRRVTVAINIAPERDPAITPATVKDNLEILEHEASAASSPARGGSAVGLVSLATMSDPDKKTTLDVIKDWANRIMAEHSFKLVPLRYADPPPAPPGASDQPK
jgi:polysaccharide deacetylase 2 family uncharacterized protein YibQ